MMDEDEDDTMNGRSSADSEEELIVETTKSKNKKKGKKDKKKDAEADDLDEILQSLEVSDKPAPGGKSMVSPITPMIMGGPEIGKPRNLWGSYDF